MIFYEVWKQRLLGRLDREKVLFALGLTSNGLLLSRRNPLFRAIHPIRALFSPAYARALAGWLRYRIELYDGFSG